MNTRAVASNFSPESLALTEPVPLTMHPDEVYINSLGEGSRRTQKCGNCFDFLVAIFSL
ncbi:hypothetical protein [Nostoc sp. LEGE 12450]|uniref:hypothetical protein n=1 Tax=Nostoc sp. LEGE 12450 TaxID=1828643 RepID=UPI001D1376DA|nr:hypothetical protein [Nostoc sp. LEGE 12450]